MELPLIEPEDDDAPDCVVLTVPPDQAGERLDKALAKAAADIPGLSRSRLTRLIADGAVRDPEARTVTEPRAKVKPGDWQVSLPPPLPATPQPEAIPLKIVHEDGALIVIDKPAGMVVHPAPGAETGTLVNALLHHCGESLAGIGGERRPGIVHRIDKDTTGLLVAAKTQAAHEGLARQFAAHTIERRYLALLHGTPEPSNARLAGLPGVSFEPGGIIRIDRPIARHRTDRKKMAVAEGGRHAVTRLKVIERFGFAALAEFQLETGRTHQIRVHAAHIGHPLLGDPVYGRARTYPESLAEELRLSLAQFRRQALHAAALGFTHPVEGTWLSFSTPLHDDMEALVDGLRRNVTGGTL